MFAGSSLMEMFPIEKFTEEDHLGITVYNRGIGGYVTQELLDSIQGLNHELHCTHSPFSVIV